MSLLTKEHARTIATSSGQRFGPNAKPMIWRSSTSMGYVSANSASAVVPRESGHPELYAMRTQRIRVLKFGGLPYISRPMRKTFPANHSAP